MARLQTFLAGVLASIAIGDAGFAQGVAPITGRDVVGEWMLTITPAERRDLSITIESGDGGRAEFPLAIAAQGGGRLACTVRNRPAECRIEDDKLVISLGSGSGGASMVFTLTGRTRQGFSGAARMRVRFLPVGGHIGSVSMTRR